MSDTIEIEVLPCEDPEGKIEGGYDRVILLNPRVSASNPLQITVRYQQYQSQRSKVIETVFADYESMSKTFSIAERKKIGELIHRYEAGPDLPAHVKFTQYLMRNSEFQAELAAACADATECGAIFVREIVAARHKAQSSLQSEMNRLRERNKRDTRTELVKALHFPTGWRKIAQRIT